MVLVLAMLSARTACGQHQHLIERLPPPDLPEVGESLPGPDVAPFEDFAEPPPMIPGWSTYTSWISPSMWQGTLEAGINGSEGNAQSFSIRTGGSLTRETDTTKSVLDITYAKTEANSVETQHNALLDARVDWKLGESPWSLFKKFGLEYDEFKAFDLRVRSAGGVGYDLLRGAAGKLTGRFGAAASRELGGVDDRWVPEANFGLDLERKISARQKLVGTIDYYPAWEDFTDFRLVADLGWEVILDESTNLSLKLGVIDRYDSTPNGLKPNDVDYSALLLWKL